MENEKYYIAVNAGDRYPFLKTPQDYEDICEASVLEYGDILEFAEEEAQDEAMQMGGM